MSTISKNTNEALVKKFVKHPRQFESYYKHCINILKEYVWMNENQYNEEVENYEYLTAFMNYYGINQYILDTLFTEYKNIIINLIQSQSIKVIHSNIYFSNQLEDFKTTKYKRVDFNIITNKELDTNKEYTINEIVELVNKKEIFVINNTLSDYELKSNEDINNKIVKVIKNSQVLKFNNTAAEIFYSLDNKNKELWTIIFEPFCQFIRISLLNFNNQDNKCINMYQDFNKTYDHIKELTELLLKYYSSRKKEPPYIIINTLNENLQSIEKYQREYQIINLEKEIKKDELIDKKNIKILIK